MLFFPVIELPCPVFPTQCFSPFGRLSMYWWKSLFLALDRWRPHSAELLFLKAGIAWETGTWEPSNNRGWHGIKRRWRQKTHLSHKDPYSGLMNEVISLCHLFWTIQNVWVNYKGRSNEKPLNLRGPFLVIIEYMNPCWLQVLYMQCFFFNIYIF